MRALDCKEIINNKLAPAYMLTGDCVAVKSFVKSYLLSLIPEDQKSMACLEAKACNIEDVKTLIEMADSYIFGVEYKLVFVSQMTKLAQQSINILKDYFENPAPNTTIVFEEVADNASQIASLVNTIECAKPSEPEITRHLVRLLKEKGYRMAEQDVKSFVYYCNMDFGKIMSEIEKLMIFKIEEKLITKKDYESFVIPDVELTVYNLANELSRKNFTKAITLLNTLNSDLTQITPMSIFRQLKRTYYRLFVIKTSQVEDSILAAKLSLSARALQVNRDILNSNNDPKLVFKLKETLEYLSYIEKQMNIFAIKESDGLKLAVNRIIEIFSNG